MSLRSIFLKMIGVESPDYAALELARARNKAEAVNKDTEQAIKDLRAAREALEYAAEGLS